MDDQTNAIDRQDRIDRTWWLWLAVAACAFHIVEEYAFNWPAFARDDFHVACNYTDYFVVNGAFLLLGISGAMIAWRFVVYSLAFPALLSWNAIFHVAASLWAGQLNPGTITALTLLAPAGIVCFIAAHKEGVLTRNRCLAAMALGAAIHLFPVIIILLRPRLSY
jgi:hypothetical protein